MAIRGIMTRHLSWAALSILALLLVDVSFAAEDPKDESALIERGRYIAHHVAMCVQCHSGRDSNGRLTSDRYFQGGRNSVLRSLCFNDLGL